MRIIPLHPAFPRARAAVAALVLSAFAAAASAQDAAAVKLDPDSAVAMALAGNLGLKTSAVDLSSKKRKAGTAFNVFIPSVGLSGTLARQNEAPVLAPGVEGPQWGLASSLSAELALNLAAVEGIKALRLDYEAGLITRADAEAKLERDVRKAYFSLLLMKESIAVMEGTIATAERRASLAEERFRAGLASELAQLQATVAAENLKPALKDMKAALAAASDAFAMTLGLPRGTRLELEDAPEADFAELDPDALVAQAAGARADIRSLRKGLEGLDIQERALAYQLYTPSLALGWNVAPTFQGDPWKDSLTGQDAWKDRGGMFRATLAFKLDGLLPFGRDAQGFADIRENREKATAGLAMAVRGAQVEIDSLCLQLEKARSGAAALQKTAQLAERAYRLSEEAYKAGAADLLDVQNAELELRKARFEALKEAFAYRTGLLDLEYAAGLPSGALSGSRK